MTTNTYGSEAKSNAYSATIERGERRYALAYNAMIDAIEAGQDIGMPYASFIDPNKMLDVSQFLSECGQDAGRILLDACSQALMGKPTAACALLNEFAHKVAKDYADNNAGRFE